MRYFGQSVQSSAFPPVMKIKLTMISLLGMTIAADAARIVWVSDNGFEGFGTGSDGAVRGAFYPDPVSPGTPFTDQPFITLLQGAGHTVERFNPTANAISVDDIKLLNTYDLVIVGSATNSGPFNIQSRGNNAKGWNTMITKPMIVTKSTLIRRDRMGWLKDNREFDSGANSLADPVTATGKLTFVNPAHPVFNTIASTTVGANQVMNNFCNIIVADPLNNRGTSMQYFTLTVGGTDPGKPANGSDNSMESGGVLLASMNFHPMNPGINIAAGILPSIDPTYNATGYSIAEWPASSTVRTTAGQDSGPDRLAGYRMHFACGTRDATGSATGAPNPMVGAMDLSTDGQTMFLNAVAYAAAKPTGLPTGVNTWRNTSFDSLWNEESINWSTSIWLGGDALFGPGSAVPVTISGPISASSLNFTAAGYIINSAGGFPLNLTGPTPTITANADATIAASISGTNGVTYRGPGTITLEGDSAANLGNPYTGGTFIRSGTVVMKVGLPAPSITNRFAMGDIEALDTGATLKYYNALDTVAVPNVNIRTPNGQLNISNKFNITGGTFDLAGDNNQNIMPTPNGTGFITNSSPHERAVLKIHGDSSKTFEFSGIISDGGPVVDSPITGRVGFRTDVDMASGDSTLILSGPNTFSGSFRRGTGRLKLEGAGRLGNVTTRTPSIGLRINGNASDPNPDVDLNGTHQRISGIGGNGGKLLNNKAGTSSVLTMGFVAGHVDTVVPGWPGAFVDNNTGSGGILGISKTGINTQILTGSLHTYSGPTLINEGILQFGTAAAPSPNSDIQINGNGKLDLLYPGTKNVNGLFLNGVRQTPGEYGALGSIAPVIATAFITGSGTVTVTPVHPSYPAVMTISPSSGGNPTLTWTGVGLLQSSSNLAAWTDLPGAASPFQITVTSAAKLYFRIKQ